MAHTGASSGVTDCNSVSSAREEFKFETELARSHVSALEFSRAIQHHLSGGRGRLIEQATRATTMPALPFRFV
jgi:hypothetical protein